MLQQSCFDLFCVNFKELFGDMLLGSILRQLQGIVWNMLLGSIRADATARTGLLSVPLDASTKLFRPSFAPTSKNCLEICCLDLFCANFKELFGDMLLGSIWADATVRTGLLFTSAIAALPINAIDMREQDAPHTAPRHGKCWAAVWLRHLLLHPHQRHRQQRVGCSTQCPAPRHVLGCCLAASLTATSTSAPSAAVSRMP